MENATILLVFGQTIIHIDVFIHGIPFLSGIEIMDFHHENRVKNIPGAMGFQDSLSVIFKSPYAEI